jgi:hypothetical protein
MDLFTSTGARTALHLKGMLANIIGHHLRVALVEFHCPVDVMGSTRLLLAIGVATHPASGFAALRHEGIAPVDTGLVAILIVGECLGPVGASRKRWVVLPEGRAMDDAAGRVDIIQDFLPEVVAFAAVETIKGQPAVVAAERADVGDCSEEDDEDREDGGKGQHCDKMVGVFEGVREENLGLEAWQNVN